MPVGAGGARRAGRSRERERAARDVWEAARAAAEARWPGADPGRRRVFGDLLALTRTNGWHLLVGRRWEAPDGGAGAPRADAVVVGPPGILVIGVGTARDGERVRAAAHVVERAVESSLGLSASTVQPLLVLQDGDEGPASCPVRHASPKELASLLIRQKHRPGFRAKVSRDFARHIAEEIPFLAEHELGEDDEAPAAAKPDDDSALFGEETVREEADRRVLEAPIENWMTYLDPDQLPLVRRDFQGPARISGPAGTGKTVVGLHRAAYLAQRTSGRVLYLTYAANLPRVQETFLRTMSPYVCERVDFCSLFKFVLGLLRDRGVEHHLDRDRARNQFALAWLQARRDHPAMNAVDSSGQYWHDEIEYVIKGRGITTLAGYRALPRRGRGPLPAGVSREMVWQLFAHYQRLLDARGVQDFHDVLALALARLRQDGTGTTGYTSVIIDEAQDLPQIGVQLVHALIGDEPNGLLLVGDGQQAVYPGGFRLSEAGVDVRGGRGVVLRRNYRNAPQILSAALRVVSDVTFEDLDGSLGKGSRDVELSCHDGAVTEAVFTGTAEHDEALVALLRQSGGLADSAVLLPPGLNDTYRELFHRAGIPVGPLHEYDGTPDDRIKLGTYVKAKGLDFKHVYLPRYDERLAEDLDRNRLFVAMTRARDSLWLGSVRRQESDG
ncbi:UvrD-helicase domain-containing protein [Streptomyces sp. NPDC048172]|uniref:UvrD-helicase domain-containing protein n=1 Tax=Streptomyces sp. NPDC048172 TaxID=3365505 RepID=UPI003717219E